MTRTDHLRESGEGKVVLGEIILKRHSPALAKLANCRQAKSAKRGQDTFSRFGYSYEMTSTPNLIRHFRKQNGLTLEQLGALTKNPRTGQSTDLATIQKLETGKRDLSADWRIALGEALGIEPDDLIGASIPRRRLRRVPLVGKIPAGNWRAAVEDPIDLIPTTKGGPNTFALIPDGDSMDKVVDPGVVIFCDPDDQVMVHKKYYAMMRHAGEMTFKQYLENPPRLAPCSSNPEHQEMLIGQEPLTIVGRVVGYEGDL